MWRALFLAIGIMLIIVGVECTVVSRFTISQEARLPPAFNKLLETEGASDSANLPLQIASNVAPPQSIRGYGGIPNTVSQFGPSRYSGNQFGNDQFFGIGGPVQPAATNLNNNSQFSLAGFGTRQNSTPPASAVVENGVRRVRTKDWMPWSLIAAGTIIVLYTKSLGRLDFGGSSGD